MKPVEIAELFSMGKFSPLFAYFSDQIVWDIVGQQRLTDIHAVQQHCLEIETYFQNTEHYFKVHKIVQHQNLCFIQGNAQFISDHSITEISACDIYTFNDTQKLIRIESYCITLGIT